MHIFCVLYSSYLIDTSFQSVPIFFLAKHHFFYKWIETNFGWWTKFVFERVLDIVDWDMFSIKIVNNCFNNTFLFWFSLKLTLYTLTELLFSSVLIIWAVWKGNFNKSCKTPSDESILPLSWIDGVYYNNNIF